jgi:hypothetical protein
VKPRRNQVENMSESMKLTIIKMPETPTAIRYGLVRVSSQFWRYFLE